MFSVTATVIICIFFNDTATTEIYTLSLHDALPISQRVRKYRGVAVRGRQQEDHDVPGRQRPPPDRRRLGRDALVHLHRTVQDRKSTRLNSSHANISYAVFCLKNKKSSTLTSSSRSP